MTRTLTAGLQTAVAASTAEFVHLIELAFSGGTQRLSTGSADLSWNAQTWTAIGGVLELGAVEETSDLAGGTLELRLSGVTQTIIAILLSQKYINRTAKAWRAHLNSTLGTVIADPVLIFSGHMNAGYQWKETRPVDGLKTCEITLRCTSQLASLEERRGFSTNPATHQSIYPTDRFFEHVGQLSKRPIVWRR